jgi:hypothetical protein
MKKNYKIILIITAFISSAFLSFRPKKKFEAKIRERQTIRAFGLCVAHYSPNV